MISTNDIMRNEFIETYKIVKGMEITLRGVF